MASVTALAFIAATCTSMALVTLLATQAEPDPSGNDFIPHRTELSVAVTTLLRVGITTLHLDGVPEAPIGSSIDAERSRTSNRSAFFGMGLNWYRPQLRSVPPPPPVPVPPLEPALPGPPLEPAAPVVPPAPVVAAFPPWPLLPAW